MSGFHRLFALETQVKHTLDIVAALKEEISLLERAYPPSDDPNGSTPGGVHLKRISALIADLVREIEINAPQV